MSPSSWTATAAGRSNADCRASRATRRAPRTFAASSTARPRLGIEYLTLWAFSTENWRRPRDEVDGILRILGRGDRARDRRIAPQGRAPATHRQPRRAAARARARRCATPSTLTAAQHAHHPDAGLQLRRPRGARAGRAAHRADGLSPRRDRRDDGGALSLHRRHAPTPTWLSAPPVSCAPATS